jgi:hypothetical protein
MNAIERPSGEMAGSKLRATPLFWVIAVAVPPAAGMR